MICDHHTQRERRREQDKDKQMCIETEKEGERAVDRDSNDTDRKKII